MRYPRTLALVATAVLYLLLGPVVVLVVALALAVPRSRRRLLPWLRPTRRVVAAWAGAVALVVAVPVLAPDGWFPIPPGGGSLLTPSYVGRAVSERPISMTLPQHPGLAPNGRSSMHNDAWASDAYAGPGPTGDSPEVDTAWYGLEECATLAFDEHERLVALCGNRTGPVLHVLDPDTMRPLVTKDLPDRRGGSGKRPWEDLCGGSYFYLDAEDRAVLATTDRRVLVVATDDGAGDPDLTVDESYDLSGVVPDDDCLIALMPDWEGRIWWVTADGLVGTITDTGASEEPVVRTLDLDEEVANSLATGEDGGVYVVTVEALYKLVADDRKQLPVVRWRTPYDRGDEQKPGQLSRGSGTTPTLLPDGLVAITDNADERMHVIFLRTDDGQEVCRAAVFGKDASATDNSLVSVGDGGVVVENNHGYHGPWSTLLGFATQPGFARVDVARKECRVAWTSEATGPTSVAKVSLRTGLVYAYTKRPSRWGVSAWYLTALDARTGRTAFAVRTGLGSMFNNHYAAVTLAPDGSAYVATLAGLVRVRDRVGE
ncbi:hypothetical protein [Nocardioides lianchengensis]|uniref:PQQ-like domain-containing protein n=1 Tax=Nocardioides lianchengensis TaxID=1045774 RepID=A0A1G7AAP4_9ACTN|nr:hypothetical protein [Nocardioides lianchengensis]NYG13653.1 hypothetical protein [Nocardioides lianchengensis]SDE11869.1 hypothetical protein SAMN05421872_11544 [Nocardioides lianchengensis]